MTEKQPIKYDRLLLRYGELALKSDHVRRRFENRLLGNIRSGLDRNNVDYSIEREMGRIFVVTGEIEEAAEILSRVFGLVSVSPVRTVTVGSDLKKLTETAGEIGERYIDRSDSFAVRARRTGNQNFTSQMIEREAGAEVQGRTMAEVELETPDKTLYIEVRQNKAYFYVENYEAPGGLPLGTQGDVLVLFNGSMDSAVAAWLMMKRGCRVTPLYMECSPYTTDETDEKAEKVFKVLRDDWGYGDKMSLLKAPHGKALFMFTEECRNENLDVLSRRQMLRVASRVAKKEGAKAVVTGDSLNQDASQTLDNMGVIDAASELPVFRPLITWDKESVQKKARDMGIADVATEDVPWPPRSRRPRGRISPEELEKEEEIVDAEALAEEAAGEASPAGL